MISADRTYKSCRYWTLDSYNLVDIGYFEQYTWNMFKCWQETMESINKPEGGFLNGILTNWFSCYT